MLVKNLRQEFDERTATPHVINAFSAPAITSSTHFFNTLLSGNFSRYSFGVGCSAQMALPHSKMGMTPSPDVHAFHPKTPSSCSPKVAISSPVFSSISRYSVNNRNVPYCEKKLSDEGSCSGRLASKYSRHARTVLSSSGDVSVARGTIPANWEAVGGIKSQKPRFVTFVTI